MSGIIQEVGKALAVAGIAAAHAVGSTVEKACEIAVDAGKGIGQASCEAAKATAEIAETVAEVAASAVKKK